MRMQFKIGPMYSSVDGWMMPIESPELTKALERSARKVEEVVTPGNSLGKTTAWNPRPNPLALAIWSVNRERKRQQTPANQGPAEI